MNCWYKQLSLALLFLLSACASLPGGIERTQSHALDLGIGRTTPLGRIADVSTPTLPATSGFKLLPVGPQALDARLALMQRAERSIDAQYYLIQKDASGLRFLQALREAEQRGVRVRLLVDDLFTIETDAALRALDSLPNIEVRLFNPFAAGRNSNTTRLIAHLFDLNRVNHRMHNKLLLVDNVISVSGGRNVADEYFNNNANNNFIDLDVLSVGAVVPAQSHVFDTYWNSAVVFPIRTIVGGVANNDTQQRGFAMLAPYAEKTVADPGSSTLNTVSIEDQLRRGKLEMVAGQASVMADVPEKALNLNETSAEGTVNKALLEVLQSSRSEVIMMSPYFIPLERHMETMRRAVQNKVRVVVITNSIGSTDEPLVYAAYAKRRKAMLQAGVEVYEINPEETVKRRILGNFRSLTGGLHAKVALVDKRLVFIGSLNLDARSSTTNTEMGVLIDSPQLAEDVKELMRTTNVAYRLRLGQTGEIEWITTKDGEDVVFTTEPNLGFGMRIKLFLLSPLISERLL